MTTLRREWNPGGTGIEDVTDAAIKTVPPYGHVAIPKEWAGAHLVALDGADVWTLTCVGTRLSLSWRGGRVLKWLAAPPRRETEVVFIGRQRAGSIVIIARLQ